MKRGINIHKLIGGVTRSNGRAAKQRAMKKTYARFANRHPDWAASLFDEHFLLNHVAPILEFDDPERHDPDPTALASAWMSQLKVPPDFNRRHYIELLGVANDFLNLLSAELQGQKHKIRAKPRIDKSQVEAR